MPNPAIKISWCVLERSKHFLSWFGSHSVISVITLYRDFFFMLYSEAKVSHTLCWKILFLFYFLDVLMKRLLCVVLCMIGFQIYQVRLSRRHIFNLICHFFDSPVFVFSVVLSLRKLVVEKALFHQVLVCIRFLSNVKPNIYIIHFYV